MKISVLLISKLEKNRNAMKSMIEDEEIQVVGESAGGSAALEKIESVSPDIIIMSLGVGDTDILSLTERVILNKPRTHVILLTEYLDIDILQSAMRVGAHNVIEFPTSVKEFSQYIKSVYHNESLRLESLNKKQNLTWMSQIISVFGPKGGLGKTTIAVNLAARLAEYNKKVALIDLDLQFGDINIFLDIDTNDTILELVQESFSANIDSVRSYMSLHSSGVHTLCAPKSPEYAEMISSEKIQSLLNLLRTYYDYVIIDTPSVFNETTITALEASSTILFITSTDDISILKNSRLSLSLLKSLQQGEKVKLIVNKSDDNSSVSIKNLENVLGYSVWMKLQSDEKAAKAAINRGIPFVINNPNSRISQSIFNLSETLLKGEGRPEERIVQDLKKQNFIKLKSGKMFARATML
ncbi:MAG: AAA family ATPase [Bacillota bacterium]